MEPWEDGPRVRPIPLDDTIDGSAQPEPGTPRRPRNRPWVPMVLALVGVVVAVTSVSVFGALRFDDPPPPTSDEFAADITDDEGSTTTATTLPRRLDEILPGLTDRLTLITERDGQLEALLWDPSFREPRAVPLDIEQTPAARFTSAEFDRSGRLVAVERCSSLRCDVFVGTPTDLGPSPDLRGTLDTRWHASEVSRIAWVVPSGEGYEIQTGEVNPLSGSIEDADVALTVDTPVRIVQWDAFGFVLGNTGTGSAARTTAVSVDGTARWERSGTASSATDRVVAVSTVTEVSDGDSTAQWTLIDRETGEDVAAAGAIEPTAVFVGTSDAADLVAQLSARDDGPYSLRVSGGSMSAQRIVTVQQRYDPVGFTDGGTWFVLADGRRNIVFVRWNQSSSHEVVAPVGHRVLGLDVG